MKVVLTGGGTGGHIYPALAVAGALRAEGGDIRLSMAGRAGSLEERLAREAGLDFLALPGRPVAGGGGRLRPALTLMGGLIGALCLLRREKPDVVLGTGGYVSTALGMAQSRLLHRPLVLVEGNAVPGRTNRFLAARASACCIAFKAAQAGLRCPKVVLTGYPVRQEFLTPVSRTESRARFGLDAEAFTLLVVGGSQGAVALNETVRESISRLSAEGVQVLHQLGPRNAGSQTDGVPGWVAMPYIDDMPAAFAAADAVLCRAGTSTIHEMAVCGAAAVLVPYPFAADAHQQANARELQEEGRVLVIQQELLTPDTLVQTVLSLKTDPGLSGRLRQRLKEWAKPDAAMAVARTVLEVTHA